MELKILTLDYKRVNLGLNLKSFSLITIILNLFCIISGIFYIISPIYIPMWDVFGIILPITLFANLFLIFSISKKVNKNSRQGSRIYKYCLIFLVYYMISMFSIMGGNLLLSVSIISEGLIIIVSYFLIYFFYFSILVLSFFFGLLILKISNNETKNFIIGQDYEYYGHKTKKYLRLIKKPLNVFSSIIFIFSILFAIVVVFGSFEIVTTFIAIVASQFGIFFSIFFMANILLKINMKNTKWSRKKCKKRLFFGLIISGTLMLPLVFRNISIFNGERVFLELFGPDWSDIIPANKQEFFLSTPYTTPEYFLGQKPKECITALDIKYYDENGIELYFDVYMPLNNGIDLPGQNSTLIRIHGGAWVSGDKGTFNNVQLNKYFAAQGYIVFDIQYGLRSLDSSSSSNIFGDFTIDDMVGHIACFTHFLTNNSKSYGANLNSVFVSGGSSGGHLSSVVALASASGEFSSIFSQNLTIKGFIPLYPANGMVNFFGIGGNDYFIHPEFLVRENSPPCLIYQGTHDILNYFNIAKNFLNAYKENGNHNCSILWFPLAGHGSDFYFSGYYNQIFLYFMERFMYFYH